MSAVATVFSAELEGVHARLIEVEVDLNVGLHAFTIVGLADRALTEARERVNSALKNSGARPPNRENRKITVNLAPAGVRKTGAQYDLAIALGYLAATRQIPNFDWRDRLFLGELSLDGRLRAGIGALNISEMAARKGFACLFLPRVNANEASAIQGIKVVPLDTLGDAIDILAEKKILSPHSFREVRSSGASAPDLDEIRGQQNAKRALTIAAAGGHNLLFVGPPGVGKSILSRALAGILPDLSREESVEVTKIWSAAGIRLSGLVNVRPFRSPHQTASLTAMIGGGPEPRPGEVSMAHRGVLFLDELPGFPGQVLEALREPVETGRVLVSRSKRALIFPSKFTLVAAMNPCPCGFYGDPEVKCACNPYDVLRYQRKVSGPLLDRIDLQVKIPRAPVSSLRGFRREGGGDLGSAAAKKNIEAARAKQAERFRRAGTRPNLRANSEMGSRETEMFVRLAPQAERFLDGLRGAALSPRGYYRLLKTARTIADLERREVVTASDLAEAWSYRLQAVEMP